MAQSQILCEVRRQAGAPMQRLAEALGSDVTTFSRQVKALEAKGLVTRRPAADDRRVTLLDLTPAGSAVLEKIDRYLAEQLGRVLAQLSRFEQETVTRSLGLLNEAVNTASQAQGIIACRK